MLRASPPTSAASIMARSASGDVRPSSRSRKASVTPLLGRASVESPRMTSVPVPLADQRISSSGLMSGRRMIASLDLAERRELIEKQHGLDGEPIAARGGLHAQGR